MNRFHLLLAVSALLILVPACGAGDDTNDTSASSTGSPYVLAADIDGAVGVLDAIAKEAGAEVSVFGRVQEINRDGYAVFYIVDDTLNYCGRGAEDCGCKTPWDFCCDEGEMRAARMPVELRGDGDMPVKSDELGLRLLDLVAVTGTLEKTEEGGLVLLVKDGWHRRERPDLPDDVQWPE